MPSCTDLFFISPNEAVKHPATMTMMARTTFMSNLSRPKSTRMEKVTTGANAFTIWMKLRVR